jgi:prevent-host-death family protein
MNTVSLADAKNNLSKLVEEACDGKVIVIAKHGRPMARLIAADKPSGVRFGALKGKLVAAADFDAQLSEDVIAGFEGKR